MTLRRALQEHYESKTLAPAAKARLATLAQARTHAHADRAVRWLVPAAVAATILIAILLARSSTPRSGGEPLGQEIARNHARDLEPEFRTTSYEELARRMDRLDFEVRPAARLADRGFRLVGARYCSLGGRIAAQLRVIDEGGRKLTLYLVRAVRPIEEGQQIEEGRRTHNGVSVETWQVGDLIYGLAGGSR
jgi:hypothetical protein